MNRNISLCLLSTLITSNALATDYCISNSGSDTSSGFCDNNGVAEPWQTIEKVNAESDADNFSPGDKILFKRGDVWTGDDDYLLIKHGGSSISQLTIGAYGDSSYPRPLLDMNLDHDHVFKSYGSYITLEDIDFKNSDKTAVSFSVAGGAHGITVKDVDISWTVRGSSGSGGQNGLSFDNKGGSNIHISNVNVTNARKQGIHLVGSASNSLNNVLVEHSSVSVAQDCFYLHEDKNGNETGGGFTFRYNEASDCDEEGFDVTTGHDILLHDNISHDNKAGAISIGHTAYDVTVDSHTSYNEPANATSATLSISTEDVEVRNSTFIGGKNYQVKIKNNVIGGILKSTPKNIRLLNNTFVHTSDTGDQVWIMDYVEGLVVKNNIFTSNTADYNSKEIIWFDDSSQQPDDIEFTFDNNVYYASSAPSDLFKYKTTGSTLEFMNMTEFKAFGQEANAVITDPALVDISAASASADLRPQASSSVIDNGVDVSISADKDGIPRSTTPDIGAYEYTTTLNASAGWANKGTVTGLLADSETANDQYLIIEEVVSGSQHTLEYVWSFSNVDLSKVNSLYVESHYPSETAGGVSYQWKIQGVTGWAEIDSIDVKYDPDTKVVSFTLPTSSSIGQVRFLAKTNYAASSDLKKLYVDKLVLQQQD